MDFTNLISNVGFPIACVIALGGFVYTLYKQNREDSKEREDKLLANNEKLAVALDKSSDTIKEATTLIGEIKSDVENINDKVDIIINKIDK